MEATIIKSGKGWMLNLANGKKLSCSWNNIPADWDNAKVEVELVNGQPTTIKKGGGTINKPSAQPPAQHDGTRNPSKGSYQGNHNQQRGYNNGGYPNNRNSDNHNNPNNNNPMPLTTSATSPYNFVPLNDTVFHPDEQSVFFDKYDTNRNTGYIDLDIENLTDLMISKGTDPQKTHDFLKIGTDKKPIIPGSSLRGLIRKMVGVVSYSRLIEGEHFTDHALFYRDVAGRAFPQYQPLFFDTSNHFDYRPMAGFLEKNGDEYVVQPSSVDRWGNQYYKVRSNPSVTVNPVSKKSTFKYDGISIDRYTVKEIFFDQSAKTLYTHKRFNRQTGRKDIPYELNYALVSKYSFIQDSLHPMSKGQLIISGGMATNKHDQWIVNLKDTSIPSTPIPAQVVKDYKDDSQRDCEFDLIERLKNGDLTPCFYLTDINGHITSFGHTPLYRIKHNKTIKDAIKQTFDEKRKDLEQLIFGNLADFASRVFFEDAVMNPKQNAQHERTLIKILASPKPTSHQLYLEQKNMPLKNWSSDNIKISGTKEYWHKKVDSSFWQDNIGVVSESHAGYIKPLKPNNKFHGRIRFENLTNEELGALLFALELPDGCCHKIGMGKPLGLGSIRITPKLVLDDRAKRYETLLNAVGEWSLPQRNDKANFKKEFSDSMLQVVGKGETDLWQTVRLQQLKAMLAYDEKLQSSINWLEATRYMEIERKYDKNGQLHRDKNGNPKPKNEYSDREVLDTPSSILKQHKL